MHLGVLDIVVFLVFVISVVAVGISKSRHEDDSESYFLAGRGLVWWLIGFSLIAANISTEQFVGMSGNAASHVGLAIASYEWMAAVTLVIVAFAFLPYFLRAGIYTIPEFLEHRYSAGARTIMATATILIYMLLLGAVTYPGALTLRTLAAKMDYNLSLGIAGLVIGVIAMLYVAAGGLKACAWADLIQGSALILGGAVIMCFAFVKLGSATEAMHVIDVKTGAIALKPLAEGTGAMSRFLDLNSARLNMFLPATDTILPWTALIVGLWIPNLYYWGLNQYIMQRTLGSASLAEGQKGIIFAAFMKLLIPFVVVIPGIIAFNLYSKDMQNEARADNAPLIAKYLKANPETKVVETAPAPAAAAIVAWQPGRYLLALYPDAQAILNEKTQNPWVLPLLQSDFDALTPAPNTVFISEDQAWRHVAPALAAEIEVYNAKTQAAAKAAGASTSTEKLTAFKYDTALAQLLGNVLPQGIGMVGFVLAALLGAVVSSLAAMLNAASTIFSMDIYKKYMAPNASQKSIVLLGRLSVLVFTAIAVFLAPQLGNPKISNSIFTIIQESQGFISPGILAVFIVGLISRKTPKMAGVTGLLTSIVGYGVLKYAIPSLQFLNRMAVCFGLCLVVMIALRVLRPLAEPIVFKQNTTIELHWSKGAVMAGILVVIATLALYVIFSPLCLAK